MGQNLSDLRNAASSPPPRGGGAGLPCLNSDSCTESETAECKLSPSQAKVSYALQQNVRALAEKYGVEFLGFLTLTFPSKIKDHAEASKHYHSFVTHVVSKRYEEYIAVPERHKDGAIHYHLLVVCRFNVRTPAPGFREIDYKAIKSRNYESVGADLKREWAYLRRVLKDYGFGRHELLPVKSNAEAIAKYIGKYLAKGIASRPPEDKGVRLVRYSKGTARHGCRFAFNSVGSFLYRAKLKLLVTVCRARKDESVPWKNGLGATLVESSKFKTWFGPTWAYKLRNLWKCIKLQVYPTGKHYNADHPNEEPIPDDVQNVEDSTDQWPSYMSLARIIPLYATQIA